MVNLRRKLQTPAETNASPEQAEEQAPGEGGNSTSVVERASAYSAMEHQLVPAEDTVGVPAEPVGEEPNPEAEVTNLAVVGEEVGAVLKSAQEAAVRIRRTAQEEGERLQTEAESAAAAKLEEARGIASADLAGGRQIRAEAEAYAKDARAAADAFAEERRREAEYAAAQMVSDAQKLLAAADAEVAQKMREADAKARERRQVLQAEAERYEMRLESILAVFRGMSSQLEDLVGRRQAESGNAPEVSDDALEDALRPDRSN
jgi:hypothetical protein